MQKEFENEGDAENTEKISGTENSSDILNNLQKQRKKEKIKKGINIGIILVIIGIILFLGISYLSYRYWQSPEIQLSLGAQIEKVSVSENAKIAYIKLNAGTNIYNITKVKFSFLDNQDKTYNYETTEGIKGIEMPYKKTIWEYIIGIFGVKPRYPGTYNYDVSADEIGINDFYNIKEISVAFEYETEKGVPANTTTLDTAKPVNQTRSSDGGGNGDGGDGGCTATCTSSGYECGFHNICGSNVDCGECVECTDDSDCDSGYDCINNKCEFNCSVGINCFYVNVTSSISANGLQNNPFNLSQAQAYANNHTNEEITFLMNGGNYGNFIQTNAPNRTNWATWKAITGQQPIFSGNGSTSSVIDIMNNVGRDAYLRFDGLKIQFATPNPMPIPNGDWYYQNYDLVQLIHTNYVQILNCIMIGVDKYLSAEAVEVDLSDHVLLQKNDISIFRKGIDADCCYDFQAKDNYIHDLSEGSSIRLRSDSGDTGTYLVEGNHIYNQTGDINDTYFPYADFGSSGWHGGSGITIKVNNATIRNNTIRQVIGAPIYTYPGSPHSNIIIENNLIYDCGGREWTPIESLHQLLESVSPGPLRFENINGPYIVRYNTFIGYVDNDSLANYEPVLRRYDNTLCGITYYPGFNGLGFEMHNNIFVGQYSPSSGLEANEHDNIYWSSFSSSGFPSATSSISAVWKSGSPVTLHGYPNIFEDTGFRGTTPEYNYSRDGIQQFFANPNFYTNPDPLKSNLSSGRSQTWDYHPVFGSVACNTTLFPNGVGALGCVNATIVPSGKTYYVSNQEVCSDSWNGNSTHPWCSLNRTYTWYSGNGPKVAEGDTVLFRNGSYGAFSESSTENGSRHFHRTNWITYKADTGCSPAFTSINIKNYFSTGVHGQSYLRFDGITVSGSNFGCKVWYADYVEFLNCTISCIPNNVTGYWAPYYGTGSTNTYGLGTMPNHYAYEGEFDIEFRYGQHLKVDNCNLTGANVGIHTLGSNLEPIEYLTVTNNTAHDLAGDGFSLFASHLVVTGNYVYGGTNRNHLAHAVGTVTGTWIPGETLIQDTTGAVGIYDSNTTTGLYFWMTSQTLFRELQVSPYTVYTIRGNSSGNVLESANISYLDSDHVDCMEMTSNQYQPALHDIIIKNNRFTSPIPMLWGYMEGQGIKLEGYAADNHGLKNVTLENNLIVVGGNPLLLCGIDDLIMNNNTVYSGQSTPGTVRLHNENGYSGPTIITQMYNNIFRASFAADTDADIVIGSDLKEYSCILSHTSNLSNKPINGTDWATYWTADGKTGTVDNWYSGKAYRNYSAYGRVINHGNNIFANNPATEVRYHGGPRYPLGVDSTELVKVNVTNLFVDAANGNFSPRMDRAACNGSINPAGVAVGALPCVNGSSVSGNIYVANNTMGSDNGFDCSNAHSASWFNNASNWGSGAGQIGPGTTVHLCGAFIGALGSTMLTVQGNGSYGNSIIILFENNAKMEAPYWGAKEAGAINIDMKNYIIIDGGVNGMIQNTNDGTNKTYQNYSQGIYVHNSNNIEIRNLRIQNIYNNGGSSPNANDIGGFYTSDIHLYQKNKNISIHDNILNNARSGIFVDFDSTEIDSINIYDNYIEDHGWSIAFGAGNNKAENATNISINNNEITNWTNWQCPADGAGVCNDKRVIYHTDGIILYTSNNGTFSPLIYNNYIHGDLGKGSPTAFIYCTTATTCKIFNNLLVQEGTSYTWMLAPGGYSSQVYSNTLIGLLGNSNNAILLGGSGVVVKNNLIKNAGVAIGSYADLTSVVGTSDNNVWYNINGGNTRFSSNDGKNWTNWAQWQALGYDNHSITTDPQLDGAYHLQSTSSARNAGANLSSVGIPELKYDKDGVSRPQESGWDIGAYEYNGGIQPPAQNMFYVSVSGGALPRNGSIGNEFRLSDAQAYANTHLNDEITFLLSSGNYGEFGSTDINRTNWVTYKANGNVNFTYLDLGIFYGPFDYYLRFDGITIYNGNTGKTNGVRLIKAHHIDFINCRFIAEGYFSKGNSGSGVWLKQSNYIEINNCSFYGENSGYEEGWEYAIGTDGSAGLCNDIAVTNCDMANSRFGIAFMGNNWLIENNDIHDMDSDAITCSGGDNITIANNKLRNVDPPVWFKWTGLAYYVNLTGVLTLDSSEGSPFPDFFPTETSDLRINWTGNTKAIKYLLGDGDFENNGNTITINLSRESLGQDIGSAGSPVIFNIAALRNYHADIIQFWSTADNITDIYINVTNVIIRNNIFFNSSSQVIYANSGKGPGALDAFVNFTIEKNLFYGGSGNMIYTYNTKDMKIQNNTIIGYIMPDNHNVNLKIKYNVIGEIPLFDGSNNNTIEEDYNIFAGGRGYTDALIPTYKGPHSLWVDGGAFNDPVWEGPDWKALFVDYNNKNFTPVSNNIICNGSYGQPNVAWAGALKCPGQLSSFSPLTKLWGFLKSILTTKTGNAIITGNAVGDGNENLNYEKSFALIVVAVVIILIIAVIIVKIRKIRKIKKRRVNKIKRRR